jgi:structural maintenance of chromosome 3 (chondroitin sulfate proteoglycan 6)
LETEKTELQEYHTLDKKRRALEFTIYDKELAQIVANLEQIELDREKQADSANLVHAKAAQARDSHRSIEKQIKNRENDNLRALKERELKEEEKQDVIKERAKLELDVKDGETKSERDGALKVLVSPFSILTGFFLQKQLSAELKKLEKQVETKKAQLEEVRINFETQQKKEMDINEK